MSTVDVFYIQDGRNLNHQLENNREIELREGLCCISLRMSMLACCQAPAAVCFSASQWFRYVTSLSPFKGDKHSGKAQRRYNPMNRSSVYREKKTTDNDNYLHTV